jgi:CheY-like chemotaxis protein
MQVANHPMVMVADEYRDTRTLLKYWLEMEGCRVVEATNGEEAVKITRDKNPDLILMSLRMPLLGGLDATRRIRETVQEGAFPIVAMSTFPTEETRASALAAGCASFIAQPIDFEALSSLLDSLLPLSVRNETTDGNWADRNESWEAQQLIRETRG